MQSLQLVLVLAEEREHVGVALRQGLVALAVHVHTGGAVRRRETVGKKKDMEWMSFFPKKRVRKYEIG